MDVIFRSFAGGEVAPAIYGRADVTKYQTGLATCRNFIVRRHGGVSNRPGSKYITPQKTHSARGRLIKFVFNASQTYVLLFEDNCMRVIQNGILLTVTPTSWDSVTAYVIGDVVESGGANYYCILGHTNQVPPNATYWYAMPAGGIYEVPTPFDVADLQTLYRSQSGDIVTLTHTGYAIYDLSRTGHTTWVFTAVAMTPSIAAPASISASIPNGTVERWVATAIKEETYEESLPCAPDSGNAAASTGAPVTLTIATVSGALEYNVYKEQDGAGIYGFIGVSKAGNFIDNGKVPNYDLTPPAARDPFNGSDDHPACSGYLQQRKCYGGLPSDPETVYGSKTGQYKNFSISSPLRADDAVTYPIASKEVNEVRHILEVLESFILTSGVEWVAKGDADGQLAPRSPGLKPKSFYGSSEVAPVVIGDNILFVQSLGSLVRDLNYDATTKGYSGRDLCVFAPHLFAGKVIEHMDFAQVPDSIVWAQQDDGSLVGLTYLPEHEVWGWHHHDTSGTYEDVVCVPEGNETAVYLLVNRTINGSTVRYVERFASRRVSDVAVDAIFMDSYITYDGRNTGATTMTLSGGVDWLYTEDLTLTASVAYFVSGDVGNAIRLTIETTVHTPEGNWRTTVEHLVCTINAFTSDQIVTVNANKTVPTAFQNVAFTNWAKGVDEFSGADHLEGEAIAILADGNVLTNGVDAPLTTVTSGAFTVLRPVFVLHAGLPYCSDLETLDLEIMGAESLTAKRKLCNDVTVLCEDTRGLWVGQDEDNLWERKQRTAATGYDTIPLETGKFTVKTSASWNQKGRTFIRQRDPLPATILNIIPSVEIGG